MPAHGLWDAAAETAHDPLARLAVVPMVLEARGARCDASHDRAVLWRRMIWLPHVSSTRILNDEVRHVRAGTTWFESACRESGFRAETAWHALVTRHFAVLLKPPFNDSARNSAGLSAIITSLLR